jgi:hypothetical protein
MRIDIITIEICYTEQKIGALGKIKADSSILILIPNYAVRSDHIIVEQLYKWMKGKEAKLSWIAASEAVDFRHFLNSSQYDRILVRASARNKVPV